MSTPNVPPQRKSNIALIVSLCLNLLLVGVIAMGTFRMLHPGMMFGMGFGRGLGPHAPYALMHLIPAESDKIKGVLAAHNDRVRSLGHDAMDARHQVMRTFVDPAFSQSAFDQALTACAPQMRLLKRNK